MITQGRIKSIVRHVTVLNLLLLAVTAAFSAYVVPSWMNVRVSYTPPVPRKIVAAKEEKPAATSPSGEEYAIVAEQNVFNPQRKIPEEKMPEADKEKQLPQPEFVLYGTLLYDDTGVAFMDDLKEKSGNLTGTRGRRQQTLRPGNALSGFTLKEVYPDKVVMVRGDNRMEVRVLDAAHAKRTETGRASGGPPTASKRPTTLQRPPVRQNLSPRERAMRVEEP